MSEQVVANWPYASNAEAIVASIAQPIPLEKLSYSVALQQVSHYTFMKPTIRLFNIPFFVYSEGEHVHIESERWPMLSAFGDNFHEAATNLISLLKDVIAEYVIVPEEVLAEDAVQLRNYLIGRIF